MQKAVIKLSIILVNFFFLLLYLVRTIVYYSNFLNYINFNIILKFMLLNFNIIIYYNVK